MNQLYPLLEILAAVQNTRFGAFVSDYSHATNDDIRRPIQNREDVTYPSKKQFNGLTFQLQPT